MTGRHPSAEERALWRAATRDVVPREAAEPPPAPAEAAPVPRPAAPGAPQPRRDLAGAAAGLDRRSADALKRGRRAIEARLDLHGMTQDEAHGALDAFIARAEKSGLRCVLVITGRSGVLRQAVPRWLNETPNRGRLLAFAEAQPRHGGAGALYLLLRRRR
jgi:DNA-nicking Smr family endonuclease